MLGLRPFDVQLIGGMILHEGQIAEMRTGEERGVRSVRGVWGGKGVLGGGLVKIRHWKHGAADLLVSSTQRPSSCSKSNAQTLPPHTRTPHTHSLHPLHSPLPPCTGEGKTLVAVLPSYLNALAGKGVHVVTVNDYLARRDSEWVGQVPRFLGMQVGGTD